jgi:hypothetical protein
MKNTVQQPKSTPKQLPLRRMCEFCDQPYSKIVDGWQLCNYHLNAWQKMQLE